MRPEQPKEPASMHMTVDRPTRQPGTPVGELLARPSSQRASTSRKPSTSQSLGMPLDVLCSDSDSDLAYVASPSSPEQGERPKPSAAPHLNWSASAREPSDADLHLPTEEFGDQATLSLPILAAKLISSFANNSRSLQPTLRLA